MRYEETVIQKISYTREDVEKWVRKFAADQLGVSLESIKENDLTISIPFDDTQTITVQHTKRTNNDREETNNGSSPAV